MMSHFLISYRRQSLTLNLIHIFCLGSLVFASSLVRLNHITTTTEVNTDNDVALKPPAAFVVSIDWIKRRLSHPGCQKYPDVILI